MCRSKKNTDVIEPKPQTPRNSRSSRPSSIVDPQSSINFTTTGSSYSSLSSSTSLSGFKASLPENPLIYKFSEITSATGNFLRNRFSSSTSSSSWRCSIRGKDVFVVQRKLRRSIDLPELQTRLSTVCRSHHSSLIKLIGASISGNYIYLVYEFVPGSNLSNCLRNPRNPSFTILSSWLARMQIATDLAHGLDYIHHCSGLRSNFIHNHIKSSSIIITEESMNAKICHFGTSELCGETESEILNTSADGSTSKKTLKRTGSRAMKVEGTRGYMSPELQLAGILTQKCDVYAFGVVILELISGEEALKYRLEEGSDGGYRRVSVIETARAVIEGGWELRKWVDRRLGDSYPVEVAEKMIRMGLDCVEEDPDKRPDMGRIALQVSKMYLDSKSWADKIGIPTDFSVSFAPR